MRILLVQSYLGGNEPAVLPLGLSILAAVLPDHEIEILDLNLSKKPFEELNEAISRLKPDVVGISVRNIDSTNKRKVTFYYEYLKPTLRQIRDISRDSVIVLGGPGFSMFAERVMQEACEADFGVYLEAEQTFPQLIENLNQPENVPGLYYRRNGEIHFTGKGKAIDLENLPKPRWDLVDMEEYSSLPWGVGIETKRGCSLTCAYCPYPFLNGRQYRLKSPKLVVDEIEEIHFQYGVKEFAFIDSVFNIPFPHARQVCQEIVDRDLDVQWTAWFNEKNITEEFVRLARRAGCTNFIFSPDGFSDSVLNRLQKNINKQDILKTFNTISKVGGIRVSYNFFKNPPEQTLAAAIQMAIFFLKAKQRLGDDQVGFELNSLRVEPHTSLVRIAEREGDFHKGEDLLYPKYYSRRKTRYLEHLFNLLLWMKGK